MHICILCERYPYKDLAYFTFVQQLAQTIAEIGWKVTVIAPQSITKNLIRRLPTIPYRRIDKTPNGAEVEVISPSIFTIGNMIYKSRIIDNLFIKYLRKKISKTILRLRDKPDILYGHFWHTAFLGYPYAQKNRIPLFVASGEAEIELHKRISVNELKDFIHYVSGVICVSSKNKAESIKARLTTEDKCVIIPNAVNTSLFHKKDKRAMREQLGFPNNAFIICFVGGFIHRKGPKRIIEALKQLNDPDIKTIFIGRLLNSNESELPESSTNIFMGSLPQNKIPDYLNAADLFVLPTLKEGCCNAIIEAMACGLPIVSSNRDFNYDILDETCSIMIEPENAEEIAHAIKKIKDDSKLKEKLGQGALNKAENLTIMNRAKKIIAFIQKNSK